MRLHKKHSFSDVNRLLRKWNLFFSFIRLGQFTWWRFICWAQQMKNSTKNIPKWMAHDCGIVHFFPNPKWSQRSIVYTICISYFVLNFIFFWVIWCLQTDNRFEIYFNHTHVSVPTHKCHFGEFFFSCNWIHRDHIYAVCVFKNINAHIFFESKPVPCGMGTLFGLTRMIDKNHETQIHGLASKWSTRISNV